MGHSSTRRSTRMAHRIDGSHSRDGYLAIPQEPGLGIDLDDEAVRKFRVS